MSKRTHHKCRNAAVVGAFALAIGGCSGSSTESRDDVTVRPIPSFTATKTLGQALFAEQGELDATPIARLPVAGSATYNGAVGYRRDPGPDDGTYPDYELQFVNDPEYVSRIRLLADFGGDAINGTLSGFRDSDNNPYRINATLDGTIGRDGDDEAVFIGTLSGTNEIGSETKSFSGAIAGNFLGGRGEMILGSLGITKGFTGEEPGDMFGVFTATQ